MKSGWIEIISIWALVALATLVATFTVPHSQVLASFGAILASATALVSMIHLFLEGHHGFVKKLVYVAGGSYLMLAIASIYVLFFQR